MPPILVVNPRSDADFLRHAEQLVANGARTAQALQDQLRRTYPKAVVRPRALAAEPGETWYVYREGTWTPTTSE